jgi:hypothetical protein
MKNMKTKPIILVIITLILGFVLGMLTSAQLRLHKLKPVRVYFSEERFREGFYNTIQPDEQQRARIEVILDKYAKLNSELQNEFRKDLESNIRAFRKEIDANLTKEQIIRLKEMDERRQEMIRRDRVDQRNDTLRRRDWRRPDFDRSRMREGQDPSSPQLRGNDTTGISPGK